ncbi:MAG TPA: hypothetical protein VFI47_05470 [Acidimicrobiales bacterium]|nr:hypothetical protein [Acidimicrobiales bacterium]
MERKQAIITAGVISGTLFAASTAFALASGAVSSHADDGAGTLSPVSVTDDADDAQPAVTQPATAGAPAPADDVDDAQGDDDEQHDAVESEDHADEDHPVEVHEYEGAEDDD